MKKSHKIGCFGYLAICAIIKGIIEFVKLLKKD